MAFVFQARPWTLCGRCDYRTWHPISGFPGLRWTLVSGAWEFIKGLFDRKSEATSGLATPGDGDARAGVQDAWACWAVAEVARARRGACADAASRQRRPPCQGETLQQRADFNAERRP